MTRTRRLSVVSFLGLSASLMSLPTLGGCATPSNVTARATAAPASHTRSHDPTSHNHGRGQMMIASNGVVDALLTSHLSSKDGNELDVFVEKDGTPLALATTQIEAKARVVVTATGRDVGDTVLTFSCAPADERPPGEAEGTCSHFVARATWMSPQDRLEVATALSLRAGDVVYTWRGFDPRRYAHHIE